MALGPCSATVIEACVTSLTVVRENQQPVGSWLWLLGLTFINTYFDYRQQVRLP